MFSDPLQRGDRGYPMRLHPAAESPPLWMRGTWRPAPRAVAIVGARAASAAGLASATAIARACARAGVDVISGGALGIDGAAHRGALDAGGVTVAVLGSGIDVAYPARHAPLFDEIAARGGALITQFPPGREPRAGQFPARNKIIAALADLVVVVEAAADSGTLHTARAAVELGVPLAAQPGSPGTDELLVGGALPIWRPEDVLDRLAGSEPAPPEAPDAESQRVYQALDRVPRDVGDLAFRAGLAVGTCAVAARELESRGLAVRVAGGRLVRLQ